MSRKREIQKRSFAGGNQSLHSVLREKEHLP